MGRIRSIYPDACISETLAKISSREERTFWRLLTHCDDRGRSLANARLIKAAIYPLHDDMTIQEVQRDLDGLASVGLIQFYLAEGKGYLFVSSWDEFQHPKNPTRSRLPEPSQDLPSPNPPLPQDSPTPSPDIPQDLPSPNPLELGDRSKEIGEGVVPPLAPKGATEDEGASPAPDPKPPSRPRKAKLQSDDITPEAEPNLQKVFTSWPKTTPTGEQAHKGPYASAARAFQKILSTENVTAKELEVCGMLYARADQFGAEERRKVLEIWDYRGQAVMHVSTFYGPEKRPYRQFLALAREILARKTEGSAA